MKEVDGFMLDTGFVPYSSDYYPVDKVGYNPNFVPTWFNYAVGDTKLPSVGGTVYYDSDGRPTWMPSETNRSKVPLSLLPDAKSTAYSPATSARLREAYGEMPADYGATSGVLYNTQGVPYRDAYGYWLSPYAPVYFADSHPYLANEIVRHVRPDRWGPQPGSSAFVDMVTQAIIPFMYPASSDLPTVPDDYDYQLRRGSY